MNSENAVFLKAFGQNEIRVEGRAVRAHKRPVSASRQVSQKDSIFATSLLTPRCSRGFTLLEMLAVIVLLGIVAVIVARSVSGRVDAGKWDAGKIGVTKLDQDVQAYALDNGSPPKSLEALLTKPSEAPSWNGPYAKPADMTDPFGHPYGYIYPGKHGQYDIIFYGQDGKPGGEGVDRDYGNWQ